MAKTPTKKPVPKTKKPAPKKPMAKPSVKATPPRKPDAAPPRGKHGGGRVKTKSAPVTKRVVAARLAKEIVKAEPALRRGRPQISDFGHARHVQGDEAKMLQDQLLLALAKPRSFQALGEAFPMVTENQLRYQLVTLRTAKKVVKVGAREATVYQLVRP